MSRFARAVGVWSLKLGEEEIELKPRMGDNRKLMKIMMNDQLKKDKSLLMERFMDFLEEIIVREYPEENKEDIKMAIEFNVNYLFEETLIAYNWTSRHELEKSKQEELKKLTLES